MIKVFTMTIFFIRDLLFDSKDEYKFTSHNFNVRKFLVFVILALLLALNYQLTKKIIIISKENLDMQHKLEACKY